MARSFLSVFIGVHPWFNFLVAGVSSGPFAPFCGKSAQVVIHEQLTTNPITPPLQSPPCQMANPANFGRWKDFSGKISLVFFRRSGYSSVVSLKPARK
jgi:hypothetical protein